MKKLLLISNVVLFAALIVLYVLFFSCKSKMTSCGKGTSVNFANCDSMKNTMIPIAYVNVDSLLLNYDFAKEENEKLITRQENSRLTLTQKMSEFEKDYVDFQRKLENNVYATRERAEQEGNRLAKKQQDIKDLETRLTNELFDEQQKINNQLKDSLNLVLKNYNQEKGFHVIFSNTMDDNILYADEKYNATNDVIEILNSRYTKKK